MGECANCATAKQERKAVLDVRNGELEAARLNIKAYAAVRRYKPPAMEMEQAAQLLADLWMVLHEHGVDVTMFRDLFDINDFAMRAVDARRRHELALAAICDGPYSLAAGSLTSSIASRLAGE